MMAFGLTLCSLIAILGFVSGQNDTQLRSPPNAADSPPLVPAARVNIPLVANGLLNMNALYNPNGQNGPYGIAGQSNANPYGNTEQGNASPYGNIGHNNGKHPSSCPPKVWSSYCPTSPGPFKSPVKPQLIDYILRLHNYYRNLESSPGQTEVPMTWNWNLAALAEGNVMQCAVAHDSCASQIYKTSAQNLALHAYSGQINDRPDNDLIKASIDSWWNEYKANQKQGLGRGRQIAIGCAASRFFTDNMHKYLLACNYATLDFYGNPEVNPSPRLAAENLLVFS